MASAIKLILLFNLQEKTPAIRLANKIFSVKNYKVVTIQHNNKKNSPDTGRRINSHDSYTSKNPGVQYAGKKYSTTLQYSNPLPIARG